MKTSNTKWHVIAAICFILAVLVLIVHAAGEAQSLKLQWTFTPNIVVYYDYDTNGTPVGGPKTYTNWPDSFVLRGTNVAGGHLSSWPVIVAFPAMSGGQVVTSMTVGPFSSPTMFFTLTASNSSGESYYSNATFNTNTPNNPSTLKAFPPIPGR